MAKIRVLVYNTHLASSERRQMLALQILDCYIEKSRCVIHKITIFNLNPIIKLLTRGQSNLTKSASRGPIPRLGVTPGGRKLYHWIPGVGFPISVP